MKTLIVFISDLHIKENTTLPGNKISNIRNIISNNNYEHIILVLGGDISFSGKKEEFDIAYNFVKDITKDFDNISVFSIPGNHDILYEEGFSRKREHIIGITPEEYSMEVENEIKRLTHYYEFESKIDALNKRGVHFKSISKLFKMYSINTHDNNIIKLYLHNNSIFTHFDIETDVIKDNEYGIMRFPEFEYKIENNENIFNVFIMHFPKNFYNENSTKKIEEILNDKVHLVLTGHIHRAHSKINNSEYNIPMYFSTGQFNNFDGTDSNFLTISIGTSREVEVKHYEWDNKALVYEENRLYNKKIPYTFSTLNDLSLDNEFIKTLYKDDIFDINFFKYFVFPKIVLPKDIRRDKTDKLTQISSFDELMTYIEENEVVMLIGKELSGKTTLLKYIHKNLINDNLVIHSNARDFENTNIRKTIENLIKEQYVKATFGNFNSVNKMKRILIIDDFDKLICDKSTFIEDANKYFSKIIVTHLNSQSIIPIEIQDRELFKDQKTIKLNIEHFYKRDRDELILKVYDVISSNGENVKRKNKDVFLKQVSKLIESNLTFFTLNPYMIVQVTKYLYNNANTYESKNIYTDVFTANITMQIDSIKKTLGLDDVTMYLTVLQKIAFHMVTNQKSFLKNKDFGEVVDVYNEEFAMQVELGTLINLMKKSRIINERNGSLSFVSDTYLAYFASKEYIRRTGSYEENKEYFSNLTDNLFIGVNSKVLLFITLHQQNMSIIDKIIEQIEGMYSDNNEIDMTNFSFLSESKHEIDKFMTITKKDRENRMNLQEEAERKFEIENEEKSKTPFNELELDEHEKKFNLGIGFIKLLSTILPSFITNMEVNRQNRLVKLLYELPNKVLYNQFNFLNDHKEDILKLAYEDLKEKSKRSDFNESRIKEILYIFLVDIVRASILSVYDYVARTSYDVNTKNAIIDRYNNSISSHEIQKLMFKSFELSESGMEEFKEEAVKLFKTSKEERNVLLTNCVRLIVRRFVLDHDSIEFHGKDEKFLNNFFDKKRRRELMIYKRTN